MSTTYQNNQDKIDNPHKALTKDHFENLGVGQVIYMKQNKASDPSGMEKALDHFEVYNANGAPIAHAVRYDEAIEFAQQKGLRIVHIH